MALPVLTPIVLRLLLLFTTALVLEKFAALFFGPLPAAHFALSFGQNFHPAQILTHIFFNGMPLLFAMLHLLFHGLFLVAFGSELERLWGPQHFLRFVLFATLGGMAAGALLALSINPLLMVSGFSAMVAAVMVAYAAIWPNREVLFFFVIPIKMKWLIPIMLLFFALGAPLGRLALLAGGALTAVVWLFYYARRGRLHMVYSGGPSSSGGWSPRGTGGSFSPSAMGQSQSEDSSVQSGQKKGGGLFDAFKEYQRKKRLEKKRQEIEGRIDMKAEVDRLLEKISTDGIDSLSRKEKAFLDRASREL